MGTPGGWQRMRSWWNVSAGLALVNASVVSNDEAPREVARDASTVVPVYAPISV
jgi:hypothetical protein